MGNRIKSQQQKYKKIDIDTLEFYKKFPWLTDTKDAIANHLNKEVIRNKCNPPDNCFNILNTYKPHKISIKSKPQCNKKSEIKNPLVNIQLNQIIKKTASTRKRNNCEMYISANNIKPPHIKYKKELVKRGTKTTKGKLVERLNELKERIKSILAIQSNSAIMLQSSL